MLCLPLDSYRSAKIILLLQVLVLVRDIPVPRRLQAVAQGRRRLVADHLPGERNIHEPFRITGRFAWIKLKIEFEKTPERFNELPNRNRLAAAQIDESSFRA